MVNTFHSSHIHIANTQLTVNKTVISRNVNYVQEAIVTLVYVSCRHMS